MVILPFLCNHIHSRARRCTPTPFPVLFHAPPPNLGVNKLFFIQLHNSLCPHHKSPKPYHFVNLPSICSDTLHFYQLHHLRDIIVSGHLLSPLASVSGTTTITLGIHFSSLLVHLFHSSRIFSFFAHFLMLVEPFSSSFLRKQAE